MTARRYRSPLDGWELTLLVLLIVLTVSVSLAVPGFYPGFAGFLALAENFLPFGLVALGLSTVILSGGIDLSVGAVAALSAVVMADLWSGLHLSIWLSAAIGLVAGGLLGGLNGFVIVRLRTEPLIATLATSFILGSVATALAGESPPSGFPDAFNSLGAGTIGDVVPVQLVLFTVLAGTFALVIGRTAFGRRIVIIGYNSDAANYSGIRVGRVLIAAYVISGLMAALAGIVLAAYYSAVRPDMGGSLLLTTITMVVLGGVSIFGGEGKITGVVLSVLLLGVMRQALLIAGFSDMVTTMLTGAILLAAIAVKNLASGQGFGIASLFTRYRHADPSRS